MVEVICGKESYFTRLELPCMRLGPEARSGPVLPSKQESDWLKIK